MLLSRSWLGVLIALVSVGASGRAQNYLQSCQEEDGHWSAAAHGGEATADLRVNALVLLAYLGDGNTLRSGPYKNQVKGAYRWLRSVLDDKGRFALRADPQWLLDHAIATYAWVESMRASQYAGPAYLDLTVACCDAFARELAVQRPAPSAELRLWAEMNSRSLLLIAAELEAKPDQAAKAGPIKDAATRLRAALSATPDKPAETSRDRAAAALLADLRGEKVEAGTLPESCLDDPLLTFYVVALSYRRGGEQWKLVQRTLTDSIVKTQLRGDTSSADYGSWKPAGEFGKENGRLGTSASAILLLEIYYRYSRLGLFVE
ncbi:MAG: hypothetical protein KDC48_01930 [Planctomycetes bacterium]|nr:hypothetical protein [Planctomycetota bacterium]